MKAVGQKQPPSSLPNDAICSSVHHRRLLSPPLRVRDTREATKMSSQDVPWLLPLLAQHRTWQHLLDLGDKERSRSREALL
jgi:hypothetical protein